MSSVHETAYPRFKPELTLQELSDIYTPSEDELTFALNNSRTIPACLALLVLMKTAQRLGYFVKLAEVPPPIIAHIAKCIGSRITTRHGLCDYEQEGNRQRLLEIIRGYLDNQSIITPIALSYRSHCKLRKLSKSWRISSMSSLKN